MRRFLIFKKNFPCPIDVKKIGPVLSKFDCGGPIWYMLHTHAGCSCSQQIFVLNLEGINNQFLTAFFAFMISYVFKSRVIYTIMLKMYSEQQFPERNLVVLV